ncbi:MAG: YraN family protein [Hyphomicrobiaceae bacterium]|nr:YraN family protein [Hyphomicrobiaceae bacterium]
MKPSPSRSDGRQAAERAGRTGERLAEWLLRLKGFQIVARRFKSPAGELDIVARRGSLLVFVEVKTRRGNAEKAEALEAVAQRRIIAAANAFLSRHEDLATCDIRFDVIFVAPRKWPDHIRDAFRPE